MLDQPVGFGHSAPMRAVLVLALLICVAFGQGMQWHGHHAAEHGHDAYSTHHETVHSHVFSDEQNDGLTHLMAAEIAVVDDTVANPFSGIAVVLVAIVASLFSLFMPMRSVPIRLKLRRSRSPHERPPRFLRPSPQGPPLFASPI